MSKRPARAWRLLNERRRSSNWIAHDLDPERREIPPIPLSRLSRANSSPPSCRRAVVVNPFPPHSSFRFLHSPSLLLCAPPRPSAVHPSHSPVPLARQRRSPCNLLHCISNSSSLFSLIMHAGRLHREICTHQPSCPTLLVCLVRAMFVEREATSTAQAKLATLQVAIDAAARGLQEKERQNTLSTRIIDRRNADFDLLFCTTDARRTCWIRQA